MKTVTFDANQWQLVPKVPTDEMLDAASHASMQHLIDCLDDPEKAKEIGSEENVRKTHASRYQSMLAAAPTPAAQSAATLSDWQWIELANRHVASDWGCDKPDGFLNAVKALCVDFAAQSAGQEAVAWFIADDNGRPFKAVCYALERDRLEAKGHKLLPLYAAPVNAAGQEAVAGMLMTPKGTKIFAWFKHADAWPVGTLFYAALPATGNANNGVVSSEILSTRHTAPVNGGTQGVWDVYAFGKWQRRVSAPVAWDAHAVYLDMVKNGWSKDIELRAISSENYSAPVNGGEREHASDCAVHNMPAYPNGACDCERSDAQQVGGDIRGEVAYQLHTRNRWLDMPTMRAIVDSAFDAAIAKNTLTSPAKEQK